MPRPRRRLADEARELTGVRKIHVGGKVWGYRIGQQFAVIHLPGTIRKKVVTLSKITGRTCDTIERGRWKITSDGMVKPSEVKAYIEQNAQQLLE